MEHLLLLRLLPTTFCGKEIRTRKQEHTLTLLTLHFIAVLVIPVSFICLSFWISSFLKARLIIYFFDLRFVCLL